MKEHNETLITDNSQRPLVIDDPPLTIKRKKQKITIDSFKT